MLFVSKECPLSANHQKQFPKIRVMVVVQDTDGKLAASDSRTLPTVDLQGGEAWTDAVDRCLGLMGLSQRGSQAQLIGLDSGSVEGVTAIFKLNKYTGALSASYRWEPSVALKQSKILERLMDKSVELWVD